jgi:hypothetical protein
MSKGSRSSAMTSGASGGVNVQGYAGNGMSLFSRRSARPTAREPLSTPALVIRLTKQARTLAIRIAAEGDAARRKRLIGSLAKKQEAIAQLQSRVFDNAAM